MDTIMNYIDSMFAGVPDSEATQRLREDITANMSDKFEELVGEGKSENEAVGTVISEFGNIDEVLAEMGVKREGKKAVKTFSPLKQLIGRNIPELLFEAAGLTVFVCGMYSFSFNVFWTGMQAAYSLMVCCMISVILLYLAYYMRKRTNAASLPDTGEYKAAILKIRSLTEKTDAVGAVCAVLFIVSAIYALFSLGFLMPVNGHLMSALAELGPFAAGAVYVASVLIGNVRNKISAALGEPVAKTSAVREVIRFSLPMLTYTILQIWIFIESIDGGLPGEELYVMTYTPVTVIIYLTALCAAYLIDTFVKFRKR